MNARLYDRLAALVAILILATLGAFSYYLAEFSARSDAPSGTKPVKHEIDYFVEKFTLIKLNEQGKPAFRLSADSLQHYPDDDTSEFVKPNIVSLDPNKPLITVVGDRGKAGPKGDTTELFGNVLLTRKTESKTKEATDPLVVRTEYMSIDTNKETAATDKSVKITQGNSEMTGVGMDFDNVRRAFSLRAEVKGTVISDKNKKN
jgi:lipopolysaccharide export system protein LptC